MLVTAYELEGGEGQEMPTRAVKQSRSGRPGQLGLPGPPASKAGRGDGRLGAVIQVREQGWHSPAETRKKPWPTVGP